MIEKVFKDPQVDILLHQLGLPDHFLKKLFKEDDWSFVIKSHALVESVCTRLLCYHFNEPRIEKNYSSLPLNNMRAGKLGFLHELGLVDDIEIKMIRFLSEIRNSIVHEIKLSNFSLEELIRSYDKNKLRDFAISFSPFETILRSFEKIDSSKKSSTTNLKGIISEELMIKRAQDQPKFHILNGIYYFLTSTIDMHYYSDYLQWEKAKQTLSSEKKIFE